MGGDDAGTGGPGSSQRPQHGDGIPIEQQERSLLVLSQRDEVVVLPFNTALKHHAAVELHTHHGTIPDQVLDVANAWKACVQPRSASFEEALHRIRASDLDATVLQFSKYQGLGNDFLLLDGRTLDEEADRAFGLTPERVRSLCDRRFGVGADGVILVLPPRQGGELRMRIFNADGSEPEMCGNGIRCMARFLADSDGDGPGRRWQVETLAGPIVPELREDGWVRVDMGAPFLRPEQVPTTLHPGGSGVPEGVLEVLDQTFKVAAVGMGNPHVVLPVPDVSAVDLKALGAVLEVHPAFPARTNVHFVEIRTPSHLVMRVWERGAGPTLACGTGACATLVACHSLNLCDRRARVDLPGGSLEIFWDPSSEHVFMTGPAEPVFDGVLVPRFAGIPGPDAQNKDHCKEHSLDTGTVSTMAPGTFPDAGAAPHGPTQEPIDCAVVCVNGCLRPDNCSSAEARARVETLLQGRSLDDLVAIATQSLESRTRSRLQGDGGLDR